MEAPLGYVRPESLDEALEFLVEYAQETAILAGGTDVLIDMRSGDLNPKYLLDVSRLSELKGIEIKNGELWVGSGVTISEIYTSKALTRFAPALQKTASSFASKQIRNVATIGGNVAHCSPCGDTVPPLIVHEAKVLLKSLKGERTVSIEALATGPYQSSIGPDEVIIRFVLKPREVAFADFQKIGRRRELAIARVSMAVMAEKDDNGKISFIRLALGSSTPTPRRMEEVEDFLKGKRPDEASLWEAGQIAATRMIEISGIRPSTVYKEKAVQGLLMRMLYPMVENGKGI